MKKVLIIEEIRSSRDLLLNLLKQEEVQVFSVTDGISALKHLEKRKFDLIFSDLKGILALEKFERRPLGIPLIFLKAKGEKSKSPVDETLSKPFNESGVFKVLRLLRRNETKKREVIAKSPEMKSILAKIEKIAKSHSNVFIQGESGTGKEVIAEMIHTLSKRKSAAFIKVNCAAVPETLIESEFFGHEKGSFTGADARRSGRFELADQGTLLLDEITEVPLAMQAKLLRVIQEQEFERVGGSKSLSVDVRLISTSNREMKEAITENKFREDLFYRLNVIPIYLPALRERPLDILPLAEFFLKEVCLKNQLSPKSLSKEAISKLKSYSWPGNIRELRNVIERSAVLEDGDIIDEKDLYFDETSKSSNKGLSSFSGLPLREVEKIHILSTLKECSDNKKRAAELLGISARTLRNKLSHYNILENDSK